MKLKEGKFLNKDIQEKPNFVYRIKRLNKQRVIHMMNNAIRIWKDEGFLILFQRFIKKINNFRSIASLMEKISSFEDIYFNYQSWIADNEPSMEELIEQREKTKRFIETPMISILVPLFNTPIKILESMIQSVIAQTYDNWELCLVEASTLNREEIKNKINEYIHLDIRIRCEYLPNNLGISGNTNVALSMANGEFIYLLDHDDSISANAFFEIVEYINQNPRCDLIYSDEDKMSVVGIRKDPFFKPDWSPDMLQAGMYIGHSAYRTELVKEIGGFRSEYDFSQDYDLILRFTEKTTHVGHISKVLYHWRELPGSAAIGEKTYARKSNIAALSDAMKRRGLTGKVIPLIPCNQILFENMSKPLISIIIPSDNIENINKSISTIINNTDYKNYEIVIVTNSKLCESIMERKWGDKVRNARYDGIYNFSAKCNLGVEFSNGDFILFLNDDVYPENGNWLDILLGPFQQKEVGAVSPKLVYTDGTIQHAGLVTGVRNLIGTAFHTWAQNSRYYFNLPQMTRTVSALSAACLLMRRDVFERINGFDEVHTPIAHSDLDLCFKIRELGLRLVYTPHTQLQHVGHLSIKEMDYKGIQHSPKADIYLLKKWGKYVNYDPYYPTNMRDRLYFDSPTKYRMWIDYQSNDLIKSTDIFLQSHDLSNSGAPLFIYDLATSLKNQGNYTVTVSGAPGELLSGFQENHLPIIIDPLVMESPNNLCSFIRNFDLIIANTILSWRLILIAKKLSIPVIWFIHEGNAGVDLTKKNQEIEKALSIADAVIFPSQLALNKYKTFNTNNNFLSIILGTTSMNLAISKSEILQKEKINIVHIGSIEERKGQDILIDSLINLPANCRNEIEVFFIGRVLEESYARTQRKRSEKLPNIHWIGELAREEVNKFIASSDLLICTSRDETGPLVVFEAMSLGKTVISSSVGAVPEVIENGVNGFIFNNENEGQLAELLSGLIVNRRLWSHIGEKAYQTYEKLLQRENANKQIEDIIHQIMKIHNQ